MNKTILLASVLPFAAALALTTEAQQRAAAPDAVLRDLLDGNARFVAAGPAAKDWLAQVRASAGAQHPKAVILSCIDSRVPVEAVFDQGVGDIFVARVAGNIVGDQTLGSLEFATKLAGARLVLVLGHDGCGAVKGAVAQAELGHLHAVLDEIQPAVKEARASVAKDAGDAGDAGLLDAAIRANVRRSVKELRTRSPILAELEKNGAIRIVGACYSLKDGKVVMVGE